MLWLFLMQHFGTNSFWKDEFLRIQTGFPAEEQTLLVSPGHCEGTHLGRKQTLTPNLLASQTQHHLAAVLVVGHPRTGSISLGFRRVPPVSDVTQQDIGGAQQPTEERTCRITRQRRGGCYGGQAGAPWRLMSAP